jgi:hypothetical protein
MPIFVFTANPHFTLLIVIDSVYFIQFRVTVNEKSNAVELGEVSLSGKVNFQDVSEQLTG